jgi:type IV pilus assembly protein PilC
VFSEFSGDALQIITMGEESGNLAAAFRKIDESLGSEIESTLGGLTVMLEPIIIVFMALVVGSVLIAMYLPIFEISTNVNF